MAKKYQLLGCILSLLLTGGVMGELAKESPKNWVRMVDEKSGIQADFPYPPLEISFDHPFKNTPPLAHACLYSVPTQKGLLGLCTYHSKSSKPTDLEKEPLLSFFKTVLAPHLFYDPSAFEQSLTFHFSPKTFKGKEAVSFQFTFSQAEGMKTLRGIAFMKEHTLCVPFCLSSNKDFDESFLADFLETIQLP